jgi:hypothetical protein
MKQMKYTARTSQVFLLTIKFQCTLNIFIFGCDATNCHVAQASSLNIHRRQYY